MFCTKNWPAFKSNWKINVQNFSTYTRIFTDCSFDLLITWPTLSNESKEENLNFCVFTFFPSLLKIEQFWAKVSINVLEIKSKKENK